MPELSSTDLITGLGLLVLVVTLGSTRMFTGLTDSSPETVPGPLDTDAAAGGSAGADQGGAPR